MQGLSKEVWAEVDRKEGCPYGAHQNHHKSPICLCSNHHKCYQFVCAMNMATIKGIRIIDGGGEKKYPTSSFVLNCKGDACTGDVVMFEQNAYEITFNIAMFGNRWKAWSSNRCGKTKVKSGRSKRHWIMIGVIVSISIALFIILVLYLRRRKSKQKDKLDKGWNKDQGLHLFSLAHIAVATNNFSSTNKLGQGGVGPVYKAWELWKEGKIIELMDPSLGNSFIPEVTRYIHVALLFVHESKAAAPSMSDVVSMLKNEVATLPTALKPAFLNKRTSFEARIRRDKQGSLYDK